jgi:ABC-type cobalamin transport system permease subunit
MGLGFTVVAAVGWLQTAHWKPLTVGEGLSSLPAVREWIAHPKSWIGLHRIVSWALRVPAYLLFTLVGVGLTVMSAPERPKQIWQPWSER